MGLGRGIAGGGGSNPGLSPQEWKCVGTLRVSVFPSRAVSSSDLARRHPLVSSRCPINAHGSRGASCESSRRSDLTPPRTRNPRRLCRAVGIELRSHRLAGALARPSHTASLLRPCWGLSGGGRAASPGSEARGASALPPAEVLPQGLCARCSLCLRRGPSLLLLQGSAQRSPPHRSPP